MTNKWQEFSDFVENLMNEHHIAGVAVAVSKDHTIQFMDGFGYRNRAKKLPVTPDTVMGIASVSKSFTAVQIMRLAAQGILDVEDLVIKHLPELKIADLDMNKVKIKHLLSHTTGLPPAERHQDHPTFDIHMDYLKHYDTHKMGEPGEYFSYANDTFLLLGAIIEKYTGCKYARHMTRLLDELEMYNSSYYIEEIEKLEEITENYIYNKAKDQWVAQPWPHLGVFEVGGGVRSSVKDLLHYGEMYVSDGKYAGKQLIPQGHLQRMWQPMYETAPGQYYCFALKSRPNYGKGVTLVEHSGGQPGVASNFGFVPEENLVVAVLTNTSGSPANLIWQAAVNTALGLPIEQGLYPKYETLTDLSLEPFVGYYNCDEGGNILIYLEDGQLKALSNGEVLTLKMIATDTLVINERKSRNSLRFFFKDDPNKAWAVMAGSRMLQRTIEEQ